MYVLNSTIGVQFMADDLTQRLEEILHLVSLAGDKLLDMSDEL